MAQHTHRLAALSCGAMMLASAGSIALTATPTAAQAYAPQSIGPEQGIIERAQPIILDTHQLVQSAGDREAFPTLEVTVFDDRELTVTWQRTRIINPQRFTLHGTVDGVAGSDVIFAHNEGAVFGVINAPNIGHFRIRRDGEVVMLEQFSDRDVPCATDDERSRLMSRVHRIRPAGLPPQPINSGDPPEISVLVAYTPAAKLYAGGEADMIAAIDAAIAETQASFDNSEIDATVVLALAHETDYIEGQMTQDLNRMLNPVNGYMDELHELRAQHEADLVALISMSTGYCGLAKCVAIPSLDFAPNAFSVTRATCLGNFTFTHELGHNMGCHHDRDNACCPGSGSGCGSYDFSYGHRFTGNDDVLYRTVMAYSPGQRILHFSNPDVMHEGVPTGVPEGDPRSADNAKTINLNADIVSQWGQVQYLCGAPINTLHVPSNYSTIQAAIDAADDCDLILVAPGTYNELIDFQGKAITVESTGGPDVTIISGDGLSGSVVTFANNEWVDSRLIGFTVTEGTGTSIHGSTDTFGGGLFVVGSDPVIENCVVTANDATYGGGVVISNGKVVFFDTIISDNTAVSGGGIASGVNLGGGTAIFNNCSIADNTVSDNGGGIIADRGTMILRGTSVDNNYAGLRGGGMYGSLVGVLIAKDDSSFTGNYGDLAGGGIYVAGTYTVSADGAHFGSNASNMSDGSGGAIHNEDANVDIHGCSFANNSARSGGALFNGIHAQTTVRGSSFCGNELNDITGPWTDNGANSFQGNCPPPVGNPDLNGDGVVDGLDLLILLAEFGPCADPNDCPADLNGDGEVDIFDLLILLDNWG